MNQALFNQIVQWIGTISIFVAAFMSIYGNNKLNFKLNRSFFYTMIGFACIFGLTLIYRLIVKFNDTSLPSYIWSLWLAELVFLFFAIKWNYTAFKERNNKNKR